MPKRIFTGPAWSDAACWRLLCWCLRNACRKPRLERFEGVPVRVAAGGLAATLETIREETGLGGATLREALAKARALGLVEVVLTPWAVRIQIVNWQDYFCNASIQ